ncbi:uncharacterized protein K452DRAFT_231369 [Aplosporella prunicola CBS 121167]|uniref:Amino acid transporter transmembrane domain-containing protein n=1 Tax=Aplosporella prunicola CBS 121167 TaxID=1176127 RepID=A0A6A6BAD8_9PEZI|nr:uncharacterized protein K452DRAFT_231369 [Aplosporella prunicola CBS 121167]KAF2139877.1 hypothetical protein K452DRAFT_231369 [Aplosporella prunicola CBS 121167]
MESAPTYTKGEVDSAIINNPFGEDGEASKYRTLSWWQAGFLMIAETISLGILSLPQVMSSMGFVPTLILIVGICIISSYTGYVIGQVKLKYPGLHNFGDAGFLFFGRIGKEFLELCQMIILLFIMAAHILTFSIMMNVLTGHGTCTVVFTVVGAIVSLLATLPRTLKNVALLSIFSCMSILCAITITMVAVGVDHVDHPVIYAVTPLSLTSYQTGFVGVSNILLSFTAHIAFFGFISELKDPRDFNKSLAMLESVAVVLYIIVSCVIYRYAGAAVKSPAIGSASPLVAKIVYGIAIPTIVIAGVINGHIAAKNVFVRIWRRTPGVLGEKSFRSWGTWVALCIILYVIAWIIASAIPVFSQLLGLLGSLFCSWFTVGLPGLFWLSMNKGQWFKNWKKACLTILNILLVAIGTAICGLGVYGSAYEIANNSGGQSPFSCADNS